LRLRYPEEAHLFGVDAESRRARVIDSGRSWRSRADENSAASARKGGANHKRISVPGASTFSQQRPTSFDHYEKRVADVKHGFESRVA
jgi:hypothetical protein